ncbi:MAG: hypothetical protein LBI34_00760, partial [Puniceicoccales bacterium]|nr:hypothetical protein [Puniceicoccales bacterium]
DEFHETCDIDDRTVADFLIRTGATKPFIEWARKTNFQDAYFLFALLQKFPEEQLDEIRAKTDNHNNNLAIRFAQNCSDPTLLNQFLGLYPTHEAERAMLERENNTGTTFTMFLCYTSPPEVIKPFLSRLKDFPLEERLKIFSARNRTGKNVFWTLKQQNDPALFAIFYECLQGMTDRQRRRCL